MLLVPEGFQCSRAEIAKGSGVWNLLLLLGGGGGNAEVEVMVTRTAITQEEEKTCFRVFACSFLILLLYSECNKKAAVIRTVVFRLENSASLRLVR